MPVVMDDVGAFEMSADYSCMQMQPQTRTPDKGVNKICNLSTRNSDRRRTVRHRITRKESHTSDLVILHTTQDQVFDWARYLKSEIETRCRSRASATLISSTGFLPEVQDNVSRTISRTPLVLIIVSPDLITKLELIGDYSFNFVPLDKMAAGVLFFCGVDEQRHNLKRYFPNYERWVKFTAQDDEGKVERIFEHIIKLIDEASDSSPEPDPVHSSRRPSETAGARLHRTPSSATRPPHPTRQFMNKQAIQIIPDKGRCDQLTDVAVILNDNLLPCENLEVRCTGEASNTPNVLIATPINSSTFQITMPESMCEDSRLSFFRDGQQIASTLFHYVSPLEELEPLVQLLVSAMGALCELLAVANPGIYSSLVDEKLTSLFQGPDIPIRALEQLFCHYASSTKSEASPLQLPTLLHMVAKFGLQELAAWLVDLPGASEACSITNCQGHYPNDIARAHKYNDLATFFEDLMGMLQNEDAMYSSMIEYIGLSQNGQSPNSRSRGKTPCAPSSDYCCMNNQQQNIPKAAAPFAFPPPKNLSLHTAVPMSTCNIQSEMTDYTRMTPPNKLTARRPPPPRPKREVPVSPRGHKLERGHGLDFGSSDHLDGIKLDTHSEDVYEKISVQEEVTSQALAQEVIVPDLMTAESRISIGAPVMPFDDLIAPNMTAPPMSRDTIMANGQEELLEIIYQARDGALSVQEAEWLVKGWKKQYADNGRWQNKRSFKEKKESLNALKTSYSNTAEKVKEELKQSTKQRGIKRFFCRKKHAHKSPMEGHDLISRIAQIYLNVQRPQYSSQPPGVLENKQISEPIAPSESMVDNTRLQLMHKNYYSEESSTDMSHPVCQSIPETPAGTSEDYKRFSTISTSSSSSTISSMSRTSYGSQPDSGIDVPIREESPTLTDDSQQVLYDRPLNQIPRPVPPLPAEKQATSSDDCLSVHEEMKNWLQPEGGSVRSRVASDASNKSTHSVHSTHSEDNAAVLEKAPPIPPRVRLTSSSSLADIASKSSNRSKIPSPKHRSCLPQPLAKPPPTKHRQTQNSESSGSDDALSEPGAISIRSVVRGNNSGSNTPRFIGPQGNYSNVMLDFTNKLKTSGKMLGIYQNSTPSGTPIHTPRGSTSEDSEAPNEFGTAPPVPPRNS